MPRNTCTTATTMTIEKPSAVKIFSSTGVTDLKTISDSFRSSMQNLSKQRESEQYPRKLSKFNTEDKKVEDSFDSEYINEKIIKRHSNNPSLQYTNKVEGYSTVIEERTDEYNMTSRHNKNEKSHISSKPSDESDIK